MRCLSGRIFAPLFSPAALPVRSCFHRMPHCMRRLNYAASARAARATNWDAAFVCRCPRLTILTTHFTKFVSSFFVSFLLHRSSKSVTKKDGTRPCYQHERSLTTNHLHWKGDVWLTQILSAHQKTLATYLNPSSTIFLTASTLPSLASIAT
jgi:hypothetical protein